MADNARYVSGNDLTAVPLHALEYPSSHPSLDTGLRQTFEFSRWQQVISAADTPESARMMDVRFLFEEPAPNQNPRLAIQWGESAVFQVTLEHPVSNWPAAFRMMNEALASIEGADFVPRLDERHFGVTVELQEGMDRNFLAQYGTPDDAPFMLSACLRKTEPHFRLLAGQGGECNLPAIGISHRLSETPLAYITVRRVDNHPTVELKTIGGYGRSETCADTRDIADAVAVPLGIYTAAAISKVESTHFHSGFGFAQIVEKIGAFSERLKHFVGS